MVRCHSPPDSRVVVSCPDFYFDGDMITAQVLEEVVEAPGDEGILVNVTSVDLSEKPLILVDLCPDFVEPIVEGLRMMIHHWDRWASKRKLSTMLKSARYVILSSISTPMVIYFFKTIHTHKYR